jgi:exonuclease III
MGKPASLQENQLRCPAPRKNCTKLGLKILYTNIRSINNKISELKLYVVNSKPDIIAITESWTHETIPNSYLSIPNYYIASRKDRKDTANGRGGGILVYVRDGLLSSEIYLNSTFNQFTNISIEIDMQKFLNFCVIYRSPNSTSENNHELLTLLKMLKNPVVVVGDFNYPNIN